MYLHIHVYKRYFLTTLFYQRQQLCFVLDSCNPTRQLSETSSTPSHRQLYWIFFVNKYRFVILFIISAVCSLLTLSAFRPGRRASSVRSVTWRSATNQRSALTTIPSTVSVHVIEGLSAAQEITNAIFAARSTVQNKSSIFTVQMYMVLARFPVSSAIFAREISTAKVA